MIRLKRSLLVLALAGLLVQGVEAQRGQPVAREGTVLCLVRDASNGATLTGVLVMAAPSQIGGGRVTRATTGTGGTASLTLPTGAYSIYATLRGYSSATCKETQNHSVDQISTMVDSGSSTRCTIEMWPHASVSGLASDEQGRAVADARVTLLEPFIRNGNITYRRLTSGSTDAEGRFSLSVSRPGAYRILVSRSTPKPGQQAYAYYPNAESLAESSSLVVEPTRSPQVCNVTFAGGQRGEISGRVVSSAGLPVEAEVYETIGTSDVPVSLARVGPDGRFSFPGLPIADYEIRVQLKKPGETAPTPGQTDASHEVLFAAQQVGLSTAAPRAEPTLVMSEGFHIVGALTLPLSAPTDAKQSIIGQQVFALSLERGAVTDAMPAVITKDLTFRTPALRPGKYVLSIPRTGGWFPNVIRLGSLDITGRSIDLRADTAGVDVRLVQVPGSIAVTVTAMDGRPDPRAWCSVFPVDETSRRVVPGANPQIVVGAPTDVNGHCVIRVPEGDYVAVAISPLPDERWQSLDALSSLASAGTRVRVDAGKQTTVQLRGVRR